MKRRRSYADRWLAQCLLVWLWALLIACVPDQAGLTNAPPSVVPSYNQVVEQYNRNLAGLDRLWSRAVVELNWQEDGKDRHEQGEGQMMFVLPDRVALSAGKLGQTHFWAGCDRERYWLFDMRDEGTLRFGRHDQMGQPGVQAMPTPVHPLELTTLLGVVPIPVDSGPSSPAVDWSEGTWSIKPVGTSQRLYLDPKTFLPVKIQLLDAQGQVTVEGRLSAPGSVEMLGRSPGHWPRIHTRLQVHLIGRNASMTLHLSDMSDGHASDRIKDRAFDLERLKQAFKPGKIIDLDAVTDG